MHRVKSCPEARLKAIGDRVFCETFKSLQLLGFTVLYYDFGMETDALTDFNNRMHEKNAELLCLTVRIAMMLLLRKLTSDGTASAGVLRRLSAGR